MEEVVDFTLWLLYLQDALALLQIRVEHYLINSV